MTEKELMVWFAKGLRALGELIADMSATIERNLSAAVPEPVLPEPEQKKKRGGKTPEPLPEPEPEPGPEPGPEPEPLPEPGPEPELGPEPEPVAFETLRAACAKKSRTQPDRIKALIKKYGGTKLSDVDPSHYEAMLAEVEAEG